MPEVRNILIEVKNFHSPDVPDLPSWSPAPEDARCGIEMTIGEVNDERADIFSVLVATPESLHHKLPLDENVLRTRAVILLRKYSWTAFEAVIAEILEKCASPTWNETVLKLQRYFRWEYEDYSVDSEDEDDEEDDEDEVQ